MSAVDFYNKEAGRDELAGVSSLNVGWMKPFVYKGESWVSVYSGQGDVYDGKNYAQYKINNNATLRREEWLSLDQAVVEAARTRLNGIQDLRDHGLIYNLGDAMATTVLASENSNDPFVAQLSMEALSKGKNDRMNYETTYTPIPILSVDYQIGARALANSRKLGNPLNTDQAASAARAVSLLAEQMLFTNTSYTFGGGTIYSYLNHPNINSVSLSLAWDSSSDMANKILDDVRSMKQALINDNMHGPYMIYVPTAYETVLDDDYGSTGENSTLTIRERILKTDKLEGLKVVDTLPANTVVMVQMTSDVVRLIDGLPIQNIQWGQEGNMVNKYKVIAIQVPEIRATQDGKSGVCVLS